MWIKKAIKTNLIYLFQDHILPDDIASGVIISNHSLVLQRVTRKAAGIFTCHATNAEGSTTSNSLRLIVKCKYFLKSLISPFLRENVNLPKKFDKNYIYFFT